MGPGGAPAAGGEPAGLSPRADALLTLRRLCRQYHALPSQVLAEDGGLLLQLLQVDAIVTAAEVEMAQEGGLPGSIPGAEDWLDEIELGGEGVSDGGRW